MLAGVHRGKKETRDAKIEEEDGKKNEGKEERRKKGRKNICRMKEEEKEYREVITV